MKKLAILRNNQENPCPFGLPIPLACYKIGDHIKTMIPLETSPTPELTHQENLQKFFWEGSGEKCPYAQKITEQHPTVNCTFELPTTTDAIVGSPFYYKPFAGLGFDGHYSGPLGYYTDTSIDRGMYYGMYSIESIASPEESIDLDQDPIINFEYQESLYKD